ncbi:MAG: hypothetical protein H0V47_11305 [Chloroflexia bacterium]|jgi:hypothetical protein|nr:hypothetical protein [Chloroflexia bacterium]
MSLNRRERREQDVTADIEGRYAQEALALIRQYGVRVCHWRANMTGIAWIGHPDRPIEAPHPKSPMSFAILAHEVGHQALGRVKPRWREEQLAWHFALDAMGRHAVPVTDGVRERYAASMRYALAKARRRGLKQIPAELLPFLSDDPAVTR